MTVGCRRAAPPSTAFHRPSPPVMSVDPGAAWPRRAGTYVSAHAAVWPCRSGAARGRSATSRPGRRLQRLPAAARRSSRAAARRVPGIRPEDVESAIFTSSPDLTAEYPARAARLLGWTDVPLLGAAEVAVPDGLSRCVRVLLHFYTAKPQRELKHMYLRDAAKLRPDRQT